MPGQSRTTSDHQEIIDWAKQHGAVPSIVDGTGGMLRFEFADNSNLDEVDWDEFFKIFDQRGLQLVYDTDPQSKFHKFVYPE